MTAECHGEAATTGSTATASPRARSFALLGRPNSGKSSLYNAITGGNAHVGNFPGITVDVLEAELALADGTTVRVFDLPGTYSVRAEVDPETDEGVARRFVKEKLGGEGFAVVQVVDATQLALGLRLTREIADAGWPMYLVVTQSDLLASDGKKIDVRRLEEELGVPVALVSARDASAKERVASLLSTREAVPASRDVDPGPLARDVTSSTGDAASGKERTQRLDATLLHPVLGPILFVLIIGTLFSAVFLVADPATAATDAVLGLVRGKVSNKLGEGLVASLVVDGVLGGAGTVLVFMPQIVLLSVALDLLEASGYLARGAFLADRTLRVLGLSGRAFLPLLMGHACAIPAIGSTRIIRDPKERLTAILVLPLMTCSARLPTYALLLSTFFAARGPVFRAGMFLGLYALGVVMGLLASRVLRRTATKGKTLPLVLEMPRYRTPEARVVLRKAGRTAKRFLRDVGTTIVIVSVVLWALLKVPAPEAMRAAGAETPIEKSVAASIGHAVEPLTKPAGFDWRIDVGLIGSFGAREVMVGTMGVIFGLEDVDDDTAPLAERLRTAKKPDGTPVYGTATALALLVFFVIACQCMSTVAAIRRETKSLKWPAFVVAYTYTTAYVLAVVVYQVARAFGG